MSSSRFRDLSVGAAAAFSISVAWLYPGSVGCAILGWITALLLAWIAARSEHPYKASYLSGFLIHPLAFYWLFGTIKDFGGFPSAGAAVVFLLFAAISGLQYPLFILLYRGLPKFMDGAALRSAFAWTATEMIALRIFPWCLGHTQLAVTPLAQGAAIGGAYLLSFILMWTAEAALRFRWGLIPRIRLLPPAGVITALCIFGAMRIGSFSQVSGPIQKVALVQANVGIEEKSDMRFVVTNRQRYVELSKQALGENTLIVWPESVIQDPVPDFVGAAMNDERIPHWDGSFSSFLVGAVTYESRRDIYNSALAVYRDGTVPKPYHKRILMPFGEYTPFGKTFPWLKELNGMTGEFGSGRKAVVFEYPLDGAGENILKVSPLICYEDIVPALSREAVAAGAEVLANLTNDAWFGDSIAPFQHHLIASFRAIEQHRFLLRSTNTGFTAVVDPLGRTTASIPPYSEGVLKTEIIPFDTRTVYSVFGDLIWWIVTAFTLFCTIVVRFVRRRRHSRVAA